MLSNNTYNITETIRLNFKPTYLYIKEHEKTGLKYFGKTTKDPLKYKGSGVYWNRHLKKYGKQCVKTIWYKLFLDIDELVLYALNFSENNNIVESEKWANLKIENGLDGGNCPAADKINQKRLIDKTHNFLKRTDGSSFQMDKIKNGTHHLLNSSVQKDISKKSIISEKHNFLGDNNPARKKSLRPLYLEVKSLFKLKNIKQPRCLHLKPDEQLEEFKLQLLKI